MRNLPTILALGCGSASNLPLAGGGTGSTGIAEAPMSDATTVPADTTTTTSTSGGPASSDDGGGDFIVKPDGDPPSECDFWDDDCPEGEACRLCTNGSFCGPVDRDPDRVGEACIADPMACMDSCEPWSMCVAGICVAFCGGTQNNPICDDPNDVCTWGGRSYPMLCFAQCDPLVQDCPEGQGCWHGSSAFVCLPDGTEEEGAYGDTCAFVSDCALGLECVYGSAVPGCESNCCTPYCVVGDPPSSCPGEGQQCVPVFEEEEVGLCLVPG